MIEIAGTKIEVRRGSLLDQHDVEAIVNAANKSMRGGGGIDGIIHRAAGPGLMDELRRISPNGSQTGEVVVTAGHNLPFKTILHTPGPRWRGGDKGEAEQLVQCYRNSLDQVRKLGLKSVGFCSISTGVYGNPLDVAAPLAAATVRDFLLEDPEHNPELIVFAMFSPDEFEAFTKAVEALAA